MKYTLHHIIVLLGVTFLFSNAVYGINRYTVKVNQPNAIRPPVIQWVTVADNSKNQIAWKKQINDNIVYYNVYRSSLNPDQEWELAGTVSYYSETYLNDLNSYARIQSYRYRIGAVDKCGNETLSNIIFRTIYLQAKKETPRKNTLQWNPYEGINVTTYKIYKGSNPYRLALIDSVASTITEYTDDASDSFGNFYQIEASGYGTDSTLGDDAQHIAKATPQRVHSVSNIIGTGYDSTTIQFENKNLIIYPQPLNTVSVIKFPYNPNQQYHLYLFDLKGNIVYQQEAESGEFFLKRGALKEGIYILEIVGAQMIQKKLIVGGNE